MISVNNSSIFLKTLVLYFQLYVISKVAKGATTIWELISSCFGSGVWNAEKTWSNIETWKS